MSGPKEQPAKQHWHERNKHMARDSFNLGADKKAYKAHIDKSNESKALPQPKDLEPAKTMDGNVLREGNKPTFSKQPSNENKEQNNEREPPQAPQAPQPMLTPKGPMRENVDARVREKQEAIRAKMARDRELIRDR